MTRNTLSFLALVLACPLVASAQSINAPVGAAGAAPSAAASAGAASRATGMPSMTVPSFAPSLNLTAAPSISAVRPALAAPAPALSPLAAPVLPAAADGPTPLQEPLHPGQYWSPHADGHRDPRMGTGDEMVHTGPRGRELVSIREFEAPQTPDGWETSRSLSNRTFDGSAARKDLATGESSAVAASAGRASSPLSKPGGAAAAQSPAPVPSAASDVKASHGLPLIVKVLIGLALVLMPGIALAAAPVAAGAAAAVPLTMSVAQTVGILAAIRPAASAAGAVAGAIYGMFAARPKDGSEASSGEMLSSVLRYGALGGASVYMLLDVTSLAFIGPTAAGGLQPLSSAVVTAALGRTAFQGKFMDAATSSADRIVGAFPAVAAALGISLGVVGFGLVAPPLTLAVAMGAMTVTGVAVALYSALFKLGRSPLTGPSQMAKGYVLQALMTGLALAVTNPYLIWIFSAMGAAGFAMVLWSMGRELISFLPGHATPAPSPTPAPAPAPTPAPKG
ncbi:MAG: hypothetical protein ACHQ51_04955 [Elusimicrobiota bacterium]